MTNYTLTHQNGETIETGSLYDCSLAVLTHDGQQYELISDAEYEDMLDAQDFEENGDDEDYTPRKRGHTGIGYYIRIKPLNHQRFTDWRWVEGDTEEQAVVNYCAESLSRNWILEEVA